MVELLRVQATDLVPIKDAFTLYLPGRKIEPVSYRSLPDSLKNQIEGRKNCSLSFRVLHPDQSTTLVAEIDDFGLFFLQDIDSNNNYTGQGRLYVESSEEDDIPVVGYTFTKKEFRGKGLGRQRIFIMNALARGRYNAPINSSGSPSTAQRSIWERLVREEIAEMHTWNGTQRYRFNS